VTWAPRWLGRPGGFRDPGGSGDPIDLGWAPAPRVAVGEGSVGVLLGPSFLDHRD
jgi:hypothetical protein